MPRPTNTQFVLAVHMLTVLAARPEATWSSDQLAASAGTSPVYVRRVLGCLREATRDQPPGRPRGLAGGSSLRGHNARRTTSGARSRATTALLGLHDVSPECAVAQRIHGALEQIDCDAAKAIERELDQTTLCELPRRTSADQPLAAGSAAQL